MNVRQIAVGIGGAAVIAALMGAQGGCGTTSTGATRAAGTPADASTPDTSGGDATSSTFTPTTDMYRIRVKTLSKECFGSAGCNINVRLLLTLVDPAAQGQAAELTVKVTGDESGPTIETIDVDADGNYTPPEVELSTSSSAVIPKARITEAATN